LRRPVPQPGAAGDPEQEATRQLQQLAALPDPPDTLRDRTAYWTGYRDGARAHRDYDDRDRQRDGAIRFALRRITLISPADSEPYRLAVAALRTESAESPSPPDETPGDPRDRAPR
jgi:hypothetical protein